jgi:hypothetical protein
MPNKALQAGRTSPILAAIGFLTHLSLFNSSTIYVRPLSAGPLYPPLISTSNYIKKGF